MHGATHEEKLFFLFAMLRFTHWTTFIGEKSLSQTNTIIGNSCAHSLGLIDVVHCWAQVTSIWLKEYYSWVSACLSHTKGEFWTNKARYTILFVH